MGRGLRVYGCAQKHKKRRVGLGLCAMLIENRLRKPSANFIAIMILALLSVSFNHVFAQSSEAPSAQRMKEIEQDAQLFLELRSRSEIVSVKDWKQMRALMEEKTPVELELMLDLYQDLRREFVNQQGRAFEPVLNKFEVKDEIVVLGRIFDAYPLDPAEFSFNDIMEMRDARATANRMYREGRYDRAFPMLLELAKRGFKDAQSRLAYILFTGTERVNKSNLRALGWLATAAHGDTEPGFRKLYKKYYRMVPDNALPIVNEVVSEYRDRFSYEDLVACSTNHRFASGVVKRTHCGFKLEAMASACGLHKCWAKNVNLPNPSHEL